MHQRQHLLRLTNDEIAARLYSSEGFQPVDR